METYGTCVTCGSNVFTDVMNEEVVCGSCSNLYKSTNPIQALKNKSKQLEEKVATAIECISLELDILKEAESSKFNQQRIKILKELLKTLEQEG